MTELETIQMAREFIDKLANGVNPVNGSIIPESDITGNIRVSRCLFYVSTLLGRIIEQGGMTATVVKTVTRNKYPFSITVEQLAGFRYEHFQLRYNEIIGRIHELLPNGEDVQRVKAQAITKLLLDHKLIEIHQDTLSASEKVPTAAGAELGIEYREFQSAHGPYKSLGLGPKAQHFIIEHIDEVIANNKLKYSFIVQQAPYGIARSQSVTPSVPSVTEPAFLMPPDSSVEINVG